MSPGVALGVGLAVGAAALFWLWSRRRPHHRRPAPETRQSWRLVLPRDAHFGVTEAAAWFSSLAPHLRAAGPHPAVELRSEGRDVALRLIVPRSLEAALRG